jgi:diguanylate cyclase (GGDEF)-like protein
VALAEAIESALERVALERVPVTAAAGATDAEPSQYLDRLMRGLAESARLLCGTAGAAVYVRALGETKFRAFVTWACDAAVPQSPYYTPKVFDWVLETGESLVFPALDAEQLPLEASTAKDPVRGLIAVPIVSRADGSAAEQVIGTICVFDVQPLNVDVRQIDALKALGRNISLQPALHQPATLGQADAGGLSATAAAGTPADAGSDPLVLVLDRRDGDLAITREVARARREQRHLSMVLFGIDAVGKPDQAAVRVSLTQLAKLLIRAVRESDLVIDWGQHELVTVLPGLGASEARQVAERVRAAMQVGARFQVAVSAGVEELQNGEAFATVVERAREKVRSARERGHNRVA